MPDQQKRIDHLEHALVSVRALHQQARRELIEARRIIDHYEAGHDGWPSDCEVCR